LEIQVLTGGYPEMLHRSTMARKQAWARAYINALVERDIQDVAQLDQVKQVPQLLSICAEMTGQLLNPTHIGGQIGLDAKTVDRYIGILEKLFLVRRLPAWSRNELSRLIKTPKLHFLDAGLQSTLTRLSPDLLLTQRVRFGATLETWVFGELQKMLTLSDQAWFLSHYRDKDQVEVDFVLESGQREIIGIEVKAAASVQSSDFKGLRKLKDIVGDQFLSGVVLFDGEYPLSFGHGMWAIPLRYL
jgi:predicted AAA+ superfamily ATPase